MSIALTSFLTGVTEPIEFTFMFLAPLLYFVHAVLTGPVDTDMSRGLQVPKPSAASVARDIWDGVEKDEEDIFPDPMSSAIAEGWRSGVVKEFERQCVAMTAAAIRAARIIASAPPARRPASSL